MSSIVQLVEEVLEAPIGPDLISRVDLIPQSRLQHLQERYERFHSEYRLPDKTASQFRPYLHPALLRMTKEGEILDYTALFRNFDPVTTAASQEDALKHYLVYCNGIILQDPLVYILDYVGTPKFAKPTRDRLKNYLTFLNHIKPLVQAGVVFFVDEAQYRAPHGSWPVPLFSNDVLTKAANTIGLSDDHVLPHEAGSLLGYLLGPVGSCLVASRHHNLNLDLFFPQKCMADGVCVCDRDVASHSWVQAR